MNFCGSHKKTAQSFDGKSWTARAHKDRWLSTRKKPYQIKSKQNIFSPTKIEEKSRQYFDWAQTHRHKTLTWVVRLRVCGNYGFDSCARLSTEMISFEWRTICLFMAQYIGNSLQLSNNCCSNRAHINRFFKHSMKWDENSCMRKRGKEERKRPKAVQTF